MGSFFPILIQTLNDQFSVFSIAISITSGLVYNLLAVENL